MSKIIKSKYQALPVSAKAAFWFLICSVLQKGISTITTPIFTRLLTTDEYGAFNVFNSWLSIISIIITLSLTNGINMRGVIKFSESKDEFTSSIQGLALTSVTVSVVIYMLFHEFWNRLFYLTTVQMIALFVIAWTTAVFEIWAGEQRVRFSYRGIVALSIIIAIVKPVVGIYFVVHAEDKVTARILSIALVQLVGHTWLFGLQLKRGRRFFDSKFWKYAILYSLPLVPQGLAEIVLNSSDRIMISRMIGDSEAGIYSLAYSLSQLMLIVSSSLTQTTSPWIYQRLKEKRLDNISSVVTFSLLLVVGVNLALIAIAPEAVRVFAPPEYYEAIWIIPPLAMSVVAMFLCNLFCKLEFYYEKTYFVMITSTAAAVVNIVLNYVFIPKYGYFAAGYTTFICFSIDAVGHYAFMRSISQKYLERTNIYNMKAVVGITLAFLVMGFLLMVLYPIVVARYILVGIVIVAVLINGRRIMGSIESLLHVNIR